MCRRSETIRVRSSHSYIKFSGEAKLLEEWEDEESLVKRIHWNDCIVSGFCEDKNFEIIE